MQTMWAPWRMDYILAEKDGRCVFCDALDRRADLTLYKGNTTLVVMNKFPYINGHLLVAPVRHVAGLEALGMDESRDLLITVDRSVSILRQQMKPQGFNVGLNLGSVAGAGVEEHLHFHIVPRWSGDVNALTVFADVRVIPEHMQQTYKNLKPLFDGLSKEITQSGKDLE